MPRYSLAKALFWVVVLSAACVVLSLAGYRAILGASPRDKLTRLAPLAQGDGPSCGIPDDGIVHVPPHWMDFVPPTKGGSFRDPLFNCTITRLTDSAKDGVAQHHYYATLTPISADDSKVLINTNHGEWHIIDTSGNDLVPAGKMPRANSGTMLWDANDGSVFYFTRENVLMKGLVADRSVKTTVVHTFNEYKVVVFPDKTDLSVDGQSFAMWGGTTQDVGPLSIFTYNMKSNAKKAPYVTHCTQNVPFVQGPCVHGITQTADTNVIIDFANDGSCLECGNRLWDGKQLSHLQDSTNHIDTGFDLQDVPIFIGLGRDSTLAGQTNPCPGGWGLDVRRTADVHKASCLMDKQPAWHVSYRGNVAQPWAAVSFFDDRKPGPEFFNSSHDFQPPTRENWQLYEDEIVLARIDGGAIFRLAHTRSRSAEGYWAEPRAAISRDGKYVIFDSNMAFAAAGCPQGLDDCADVYAMKIR